MAKKIIKRQPYKEKTVSIVNQMGKFHRMYGSSQSNLQRTAEQVAFDRGVYACMEFIRRLTGDESLAYECWSLVTPCDTDTIGLPLPKEGGEA